MPNNCEHGYDGNLFKCPKGCHSKGATADYEELDQAIDYFQERQEVLIDLMGEPQDLQHLPNIPFDLTMFSQTNGRIAEYRWKPYTKIVLEREHLSRHIDIPVQGIIDGSVKDKGGFFHASSKRRRLRQARRNKTASCRKANVQRMKG